MARIPVKPELLKWARSRVDLDVANLTGRFPKYELWEQGTAYPTMKQLERLAAITRTPLGYFFLQSTPEDVLPIPDLRTVGDEPIVRPSPDLLETVQTMQRRQAWMAEFLLEEGAAPLPFIGTTPIKMHPTAVAANIRNTLGLADGWAQAISSWREALRLFRESMEKAGILIVINGVVGNNTHRQLDVEEFRGFALVNKYAPLIFINGSDAKAAQMFTMAHELAHIWFGLEGVSNLDALQPVGADTELKCNCVAAEFLVPSNEYRQHWPSVRDTEEPFQYLARVFKVSPLVAARRALDLGYINKNEYFKFYSGYTQRAFIKDEATSGDFWNTQNVRIGERFGTAVVQAVKEGRLLYHEAFRLLGLRGATFDNYAARLGF